MAIQREDLVKLAREAVLGANRPNYCDNPASFDPHEWVLEAMQRAYNRGVADGAAHPQRAHVEACNVNAAFEGWCVVELLGHRVRYGRASEVTMFGEAFVKIEIPSEPPAVEFYSGKALYGIRPASEEAIRAYHAPRRALSAAGADVDEFDARTGSQHDDEPDEDGPRCAFCAEPLADEPTERVETVSDGEVEIWHKRCADSIDEDAPTGGVA